MKRVGFFSGVTVPIEVLTSSGMSLGKATGFIYCQKDGDTLLFTNWHVVTGRDIGNPKHSKNGGIPMHLRLTLHRDFGAGRISLKQKNEILIQINDEFGECPLWYEHSTYRNNVDVVMLKIKDDLLKNSRFGCLKEYKNFENEYEISVMDDVFVIGYPWGLTGGDPVLPIFKRGSVASEPGVNYGGLPRVLIDCRTAKSMSGAPVICVHRGYWQPPNKRPQDAILGTIEVFAGIYSGRLYARDLDLEGGAESISDLGIVWNAVIIDEIAQSGVLGTKISNL